MKDTEELNNLLLPLGFPTTNGKLFVAGPCSAESLNQVLRTAEALAACGQITLFRAGVWKPRTTPGHFQGHGIKALPWLVEAREKTGLPFATEVATVAHVKEVKAFSPDALWIGARTSVNPFYMQELAEAIGSVLPDTPVLVKNPVSPDLGLWIGGLKRLADAGVRRLGAIHRGFSVYGTKQYRNAPLWQIPLELKRMLPSLPILHDPSHTSGEARLIESLCVKAMNMDFDGLFIESHIAPEKALSDGGQQLTPTALTDLLTSLNPLSSLSDHKELNILRSQIDEADMQLMSLLAQRMRLTDKIGSIKAREGFTVVQHRRYAEMQESHARQGAIYGLNTDFIRNLFESIHSESVRRQLEIGSKK